jgi:hypothetical protein
MTAGILMIPILILIILIIKILDIDLIITEF